MKIGMNMLLWSTHITAKHHGDIEKLKAIGYEGIEVFLADPRRTSYAELGNSLHSIDMEVNGCLGLSVDHGSAQKTRRHGGSPKPSRHV